MSGAVEEYIEKLEKEAEEKKLKTKEKKKSELLEHLGLFEKVYSETDSYSDEYPSWDGNRYYKKVPYEITDEQYERLLSLRGETENGQKESKTVATIFNVIAGIIFAVGFFAGIAMGSTAHDDFSFATALVYWMASFISGMLFIGFGKIIALLQDIKDTLKSK